MMGGDEFVPEGSLIKGDTGPGVEVRSDQGRRRGNWFEGLLGGIGRPMPAEIVGGCSCP